MRVITGGHAELELFARKLAILLACILGLAFLWLVRDVLILIFIAAIMAAGISPAVKRVRILMRHRFHRRIKRGTAAVIVYVPFLILAITLGAFTLPKLFMDARSLVTELPPLLDQKLLQPLERFFPMAEARAFLFSKSRNLFSGFPVFGALRNVATAVASVVAVLFMIVYMLIDAERLRNVFLLLYPANERAQQRGVVNRMAGRMSGWLSGQLILAAIIGGATFIGLLVLRIPYALPLAILAAIGELVPVIGPILGAIPALSVALFQSSTQFWSVLAFAILLQAAENYLLVPRVMGKKISISPLSIFIAFMMGASLLGLIGAVLALPAAAIIQVIFEEGFLRHRERRQNVDRPGTLIQAPEEGAGTKA